jgi:glutamyl-tRNA(Gln) amidotransferase subunit D
LTTVGPPSEKSGPSGTSLLEKFGAKIGQRIEVVTTDGLTTSGLLIPRYEHADSDYIVLKLKSGYNIGLRSSNIKAIKVLNESAASPSKLDNSQIYAEGNEKKSLLLLSTGGTIASRVDYRTGAVHPALSAMDLYSAIPELGEIASIDPEVVFSVYSENMGPKQWQILSEKIIKSTKEKSPHGIVVMIGTDTLAYVSAALSFSLIGLQIPVVLVGAQRSTDRPSSDGPMNLKAAAAFAVDSGMPGVFVAMHETENDDSIAIHSGVRVRKNHTSRRDAFRSIDSPLVARLKGKQITKLGGDSIRGGVNLPHEMKLKSKFEERVALVKFYPGFDPSILDHLHKERKVRGIIVEGSGLGHVSSDGVKAISNLVSSGVFVGISSQCIWGHVDLNVYETGRDMIEAGAVPLENMFGETSLAKLSWSLGNFDNAREAMLTNLVGEFTTRIPLDSDHGSEFG